MASISDILLMIRGDSTGALKAISETGAAMDGLGSKGNSLSSVVGGIAKVGAGLAVAAAATGAVLLKMASDCQSSTTLLITGAGDSQANIEMVRKGLLDMAGQVGVSADDLSKGMYLIESAGFHGAAGLEVLKAAAEGARIGNADMGTVAGAVTSLLHDYSLGADHASGATSMLIATVAAGKTNMNDLSGSLGTILPIASNLHIPFEQVGAAMATMTNAGAPAAVAATYLKQTLAALTVPSAAAQTALKSIGVSSDDVAKKIGGGDLKGALAEISDALGKKFPQGGDKALATLKDIAGGTKTMQGLL